MADREKGVKEGRIMSTRRFLTSQFTHPRARNPYTGGKPRRLDLAR